MTDMTFFPEGYEFAANPGSPPVPLIGLRALAPMDHDLALTLEGGQLRWVKLDPDRDYRIFSPGQLPQGKR